MDIKISELLDDIRKCDLVLPEFQREYVWTREKAKQLMVSLLRAYPVGSLLFWKTNNPPDLKNLDVLPERLGNIQVILDGQQRLTTLYMLLTGEIPPYYLEKDIQHDPRDLYFNLNYHANGEIDFLYYQPSRMEGNPLWKRVIDCMTQKINVFEIAKQRAANEEEILTLAERYTNNLSALRHLTEITLPVQTVPSDAQIHEAINIFDRVNSLGTKLSDAELALTHITGNWSQARREMKTKLKELAARNFDFDLTFMTRALTVSVKQRALFEQIHKERKETLIPGWEKLTKVLDYLVTILPTKAYIHATEDVNTTNAFIPLVAYLTLNDARFPDEVSIKQAVHWLYAALMWSRYTSQTDQRLEHDVLLVMRHINPWKALCEQIIDQRGRIEVKPSDLEGRGVQYPFYRITYVIAKAHGAIDWFNGVPLGATSGKTAQLHSHHIFPTTVLYKNGFDSDNHLHRKIVNEIANRAFLTTAVDGKLSNACPMDYFPQIEENYPGALIRQFIPMDPELWRIERYTDFLKVRRELIVRKINEYMAALITEPEVMHERPISDLIKLGESSTLEFKSTLQWDVVQNQQNKNLRFSSLKTIAAFLNSDGGTLIIGVEDDGTIFGLKQDLNLVKDKTCDGFEQTLMNLISTHIGPEIARLITIRFEQVEGDYVCAIDVDKAAEPIFMNGSRGKEFYVRLGNTTRSLDAEEMHSYIRMNWE